MLPLPARVCMGAQELHGSGPERLIFVAPLAANHTVWERQLLHFGLSPRGRERWTVCVFDNAGMGFTGPDARWRLTTTAMASDVNALLDHLGWRHGVHLVGLSMGGMVSLETARAMPCRAAVCQRPMTDHCRSPPRHRAHSAGALHSVPAIDHVPGSAVALSCVQPFDTQAALWMAEYRIRIVRI